MYCSPDETVEKPEFCRLPPVRRSNFHRGQGGHAQHRLISTPRTRGSCRYWEPGRTTSAPVVIHFAFGTQGEAVHVFMHSCSQRPGADHARSETSAQAGKRGGCSGVATGTQANRVIIRRSLVRQHNPTLRKRAGAVRAVSVWGI